MFKPILIAVLLLLPALGAAAADNDGAKKPRALGWFDKADADGNGRLSRAETQKAMPYLADRFDSIDTNKDGQLSRGELSAWKKTQRGERQAKAADRFRHADADGDGAISRAEAEEHAPRLAKKFDRIDLDRDGRLSRDELRAYFDARRGRKNPSPAGA